MVIGAVLGRFAPDWVLRALNSFSGTFAQFIKFFVPFIVIGLVTPAIAETGRGAGRLILITMGIAYISTLFSGAFAFGVTKAAFPHIISGSLSDMSAARSFPAYFVLEIPPLMGITTALSIAFIFGLAMVALETPYLKRTSDEIRNVVTLTIRKMFLPLLPLYIMAVIADITASGKLAIVGGGCVKIMVTAFCVTTAVLLVQYALAGLIAGRNPFKALWGQDHRPRDPALRERASRGEHGKHGRLHGGIHRSGRRHDLSSAVCGVHVHAEHHRRGVAGHPGRRGARLGHHRRDGLGLHPGEVRARNRHLHGA